jgi:predicted TIM-barrel fold metal-dependent hydrolase
MPIKRLPWLRMLKKTDPEPPVRLPIAAGALSNGEGWWPDTPRKKLIRKLVLEKAEIGARMHGVDRREFLASSCGMATTLFVINMVNGCSSTKKPPNPSVGQPGAGGMGTGAGGVGTGASGMTGSPTAGGGAGTGVGTSGTGSPAGMGGGGNPAGGSGNGGEGGFAGVGGNPDVCFDPEMANAMMMGGNELVIDMQSHFATPETNPGGAFALQLFVGMINNQRFPWIVRSPGAVGTAQYDRMEYINQILIGSPTTIGVLSGISYQLGPDGTAGTNAVLTNEDLLGGADFLASQYPGRILKHCMVMPNDRIQVQLEMMQRNSGSYHNWKTYPPWAGAGSGYWLNEGVGPMMLQKGIELNLPIFCIHKGFPLSGFSAEHCSARDVGPAARMFPTARLVIYHSGFEAGLAAGESSEPGTAWTSMTCGNGSLVGSNWPEGPYSETDAAIMAMYPLDRGVNTLIKSLRDNNIGPNGTNLDPSTKEVIPGTENSTYVYAECGGVWPALMTGRKEEAMHYWGKLLKHIGEDRIVWGTDCLWFGSPAPLIAAFKCFEISQEFQDMYGYPALTQARKEKILGQNAAALQSIHPDVDISGCHSDIVGMAHLNLQRELDEEFGPRRDMMFDVWAPKTRREFMSLVRHEHHEKLTWSGNIPRTQATRHLPKAKRG